MAFVCPDKCDKRKALLNKLKNLVDQMDDKCCPPPCCPPPCCPGPVIEIYDPQPKPCLPICTPCCPQSCDPCCPPSCGPCCPPSCGPTPCCPATTPLPVSCPPACCPPVCVPPCLPICKPVPPPCVPVCDPCPKPQPCVPCNPPQMMVCFRRPKCPTGCGKRLKSCELRSGIFYSGCDCEKLNGLQDRCPRTECQGSPECLTDPPSCGPSEFSNWKHLDAIRLGEASPHKRKNLEEYQCYPAYVKLPGCPTYCLPPPCAPGILAVPLVAKAPCPPPVCAGPAPIVPVGAICPVAPCAPCCPAPCCPPPCCPC